MALYTSIAGRARTFYVILSIGCDLLNKVNTIRVPVLLYERHVSVDILIYF